MPGLLRFGVPSLDELFGGRVPLTPTPTGAKSVKPEKQKESAQLGILIPGCDEDSQRSSVSVCISGPDGTGKSILGMHLASRYLADCEGVGFSELPKVLYISTDLKFEMAERMWFNFVLDWPNKHVVPFIQEPQSEKEKEINIKLSPCSPLGNSNASERSEPLAERLAEKHIKEVLFVDLAAVTAGDDWGFVNRMLSVLDSPKAGEPCHLLVIDSVEGFETLVGSRDAFGETQERRSRIAQVMRSAANKCHTLFIIEEPEDGKRLPEEFVTDVVIRLRSKMVKDYVRRTLEIEKARGHSHVRGQHSYMIRPGRGSTTGRQENHDEPAIRAKYEDSRAETQSYLHVCHSLHYLNREIMAMAGTGRPANLPEHYAAFGIRYLDDMLEHSGERYTRPRRINGNDWRGLRSSTTTALIGNSDTQKSPLGVAFLARCFRAYAERLQDKLKEASYDKEHNTERFSIDLERAEHLARIWTEDVGRKSGGKKERYPNNNLERQAEILCRFDEEAKAKPDGKEIIKDDIDIIKVAILRLGPPKAAPSDVATLRLGPPKAAPPDVATKTLKEDEEGSQNTTGDGIPVLLTTQDVHAQELANKFLPWLERKVPGLKTQHGGLVVLRLLMEEYTICRRLEIHDLPSAVFFHIVQCAIKAAQTMLYPGPDSLKDDPLFKKLKDDPLFKEVPEAILHLSDLYGSKDSLSSETEDRFNQSMAIRIVIEDFSILKNTYVEIRDEPLLLRFLIFYLGREGVTTLLIDTQPGQPDLAQSGPFESELRSLVHSRLYTWRFNFYGEHRVAIAPIPALGHHRPAIVRELRLGTDLAPELDATPLVVDPHFELYSGIERGEPQPVPLQIRLFAENKNFRTYIEEENSYYQEWFVSVGDGAQVIVSLPPEEYDKLRDFCYLQRDTRLDYTLITQVDEFWYLRRKGLRRAGSFRPQWNYLNGVTAYKRGEGKNNWIREWAVDPFGLYQETEYSQPDQGTEPSQSINSDDYQRKEAGQPSSPDPYRRRRHEFSWDSYSVKVGDIDTDKKGEDQERNEIEHIDRVPFMWDFGFLLCKVNQWKNCWEVPLPFWRKSHKNESDMNVKRVWDGLRKVWGEQPEDKSELIARPCWRQFLEACYQISRASSYRMAKPVPAFDLHAIAAQTFSCLVLEIWISEMYKRRGKDGQEKLLSERSWDMDKLNSRGKLSVQDSPGLINWLGDPECQKDLFKTWLMLVEVLDLTEWAQSVRGTNLRLKDANSQAVAVRHWYKTACHATGQMSPDDPLVPVGLPGRFAVRGDWFLAVAGGSRSSRLADNALDLLTSRRANHTRLKRGLGLPVRKIEAGIGLRTGLSTFNKGHELEGFPEETTYRTRQVLYKDLLKLGGDNKHSGDEFYWLWRSSLYRYYRHVKLWQDWLNHMILWWERLRYLERDAWVNGFERYDWIDAEQARGLYTIIKDEKDEKGEKDEKEIPEEIKLEQIEQEEDQPFVRISNTKQYLKFIGAWDYFQKSCAALRNELCEATRMPERID